MATDDLLAALQGLKYAPLESPYGVAGAALAQSIPQMITPTMSTGKALGLSLGNVLLTSLLGYQARRDAAAANLESAKLGLQLQSAMTPEARLGIIEQAGGGTMGDLQSRLLDYNNILGAQEATRKQSVASKLAELEAAAQFTTGDLGQKLVQQEIEKEGRKEAQKLIAIGQAMQTPEGQAGLQAQQDISLAKSLGPMQREMYRQEQIGARTAEGRKALTGAQFSDVTNAQRLASSLQELQKEMSDLSLAQIKTMIATGVSPSDKPGLAARFEQVQQLYRKPEFGATLTGNELASSEKVFGKNLAASKTDLLSALNSLSQSQFDKAEFVLKNKQMEPADLLSQIQQQRSQGSLGTNVDADIAKLTAVLKAPNVSDATKAMAKSKIAELLGE